MSTQLSEIAHSAFERGDFYRAKSPKLKCRVFQNHRSFVKHARYFSLTRLNGGPERIVSKRLANIYQARLENSFVILRAYSFHVRSSYLVDPGSGDEFSVKDG